MSKLVLHLFHADPASLATVPALAERIHSTQPDDPFEIDIFGPAERMLAEPEQSEFNSQIDAIGKADVQVTTYIGIAQQIGAEAAFVARDLVLESLAAAFPRLASDGAAVISI